MVRRVIQPVSQFECLEVFEQVVLHLELLGESKFKVGAWKRAARVLAGLSESLAGESLYVAAKAAGMSDGMCVRLKDVLAGKDLLAQEELRGKVPAGVLRLMSLQGVGPSTARLLWCEAGVVSLEMLGQALSEGRLEGIKGMGPAKRQKLKDGLDFIRSIEGLWPLGESLPRGEALAEQWRCWPEVASVEVVGELCRGEEMVKMLELLIVSAEPHNVTAKLDAWWKGGVWSDAPCGGMVCDWRKEGVLPLRVWLAPTELADRLRLQSIGPVSFAEEVSCLEGLDANMLPPSEVRHRGLSWWRQRESGALLTTQDCTAELHCHTTASDGQLSIDEMAEEAIRRGLSVLAITDHSRSQPQAGGLSIERLLAHIEAIHEAAARYAGRLTLWAGSEVDIMVDGTLDYPDEVLEQLDWVVASPHNGLEQKGAKATDRLVRAASHPLVHVIGHPTGRVLGRRVGLQPDMAEVIAAAAEHRTALEINANPRRLDLREEHIGMAIEAGALLSINTDAHRSSDLDLRRYGVMVARRAGVISQQVINTWGVSELNQWRVRKRM